ncbi:hypothetical protein [Streptomyces canus]|uniref:hypothetical protein n=1 Tax=Streptomyces canus TaxID=58343 RepID=UPI0037F9D22C
MATVKPFVVAGATALPHLVHPGRNGYLLGDPAARRSLGGGIGPQSVPGHGRHRTLAAFEALCIHGAAAPLPVAMTAFPHPLPTSAMESEHHEYAAGSGRR